MGSAGQGAAAAVGLGEAALQADVLDSDRLACQIVQLQCLLGTVCGEELRRGEVERSRRLGVAVPMGGRDDGGDERGQCQRGRAAKPQQLLARGQHDQEGCRQQHVPRGGGDRRGPGHQCGRDTAEAGVDRQDACFSLGVRYAPQHCEQCDPELPLHGFMVWVKERGPSGRPNPASRQAVLRNPFMPSAGVPRRAAGVVLWRCGGQALARPQYLVHHRAHAVAVGGLHKGAGCIKSGGGRTQRKRLGG